MKKVILFVCAAVITLHTAVAGNTEPTDKKDPKTVTEQVTELLESPQFKVTEEVDVKVTLIVNKDQEVVVLDIDSTDEQVISYIKSRLNYQKLNVGVTGEKVVLPVKIMPGD